MSLLTSPKSGFIPKFVVFRRNFNKKALKVCYKVSLSKNFQQQSCSAFSCISNGVNILVGDDPVPVKFEAATETKFGTKAV